MVEHADVDRVNAISLKLNGAANAIKKLSEDLKKHMEEVHWQGQGGETFRLWGSDMANATLHLSDYAQKASEWIGYAGTTLGSAKRMPKVPEWAKAVLADYAARHPKLDIAQAVEDLKVGTLRPRVVDTPFDEYRVQAAKSKLDEEHKAAAELMKALSEQYHETGVQISRVQRPKFPVMPDVVMPRQGDHRGDSGHLQTAGADGSPGLASAGSGAASGQSTGGATSGSQQPSHGTAVPRPGAHGSERTIPRPPERHPHTEIDSLPPTPTVPDRPSRTVPGHPSDGGPVHDPASQTRFPVPPPVPRPDPGRGLPDIGSRFPGTNRPPATSGQGTVNGRPAPSTPRVSEPGVVGGRPVVGPPGRPGESVPRGTVIGTEPGQGTGRPSGAYGPGAAGGIGGMSPGRQASGPRGRIYASEPGGVVGGRPGGRTGASAGGAFTPGGTGLPRSGASAMAPIPGVSGANAKQRRGSQRPDYLVEDEETWRQGGRRVVPPVIE
ncbi:hypothetical protein K6I34_001837 [Streptomyces sp. UNOC14_S4]|nr:hypothetical protein [Streptomyces sp. UNOC14_S4]